MATHLIHLYPVGATVYRWRRGVAQADARFHQPDATFSDWLAAHPRQTVRLLVDLPDEQFLVDTLPELRRGERRPLIERRRSRLFPATPFVTCRPLSRAEGRETLQFHALSRPAQVQPWLDALRLAGTRFEGLFSATDATAALWRLMKVDMPVCVIALPGDAGVRLTALVHDQPCWSRLLPTVPTSEMPAPLRTACLIARDHLLASRQLSPDQPLPVVLLPGLTSAAESLGPSLQAIVPSAEDLARRCRLRPEAPPLDARSLLLHGATRRGLPQFAPANALSAPSWPPLDTALVLAGAVVATIGLGMAFRLATETRTLDDATARQQAEIADLERRIAQTQAAMPPPPAGDPLTTAQQLTLLQARQRWPAEMLVALSHLLDAEPDAELTALDWQAPPDAPASAHAELALPLALAGTPRELAARLVHLRARLGAIAPLQAALEGLPDGLDAARSAHFPPTSDARPRIVVRFSPTPAP